MLDNVIKEKKEAAKVKAKKRRKLLKYGMTNECIAKMFGYKNTHSFESSKSYSVMKEAIYKVIDSVEDSIFSSIRE